MATTYFDVDGSKQDSEIDENFRSCTWKHGGNLAAASNIAPTTNANYYHITSGASTINSLTDRVDGDSDYGQMVRLIFDVAVTIAHNGSTGIACPGNANITTAAGDIAVLVNESAGLWRIASYQTDALVPGTATNADTVTTNANLTGHVTSTGSNATVLGSFTKAQLNTAISDGIALNDLVDDTTPELGGELDCGAHTVGFTQQTATGDGSTTIDWRLGNKFKFTYGAFSETFIFTAPTNPCNLLLVLVQDGVGGRAPTWPGTVKWPTNATVPIWSTGAGDIDIVTFYWDGTSYYGAAGLDFA